MTSKAVVQMLRLRASVAAYLRYERRCPIVVFERGLSYHDGNPDVLAVTESRHLIEVEIKVSKSDFNADRKKRKWQGLEMKWQSWKPRQFYYAVPPEMSEWATDHEFVKKHGFGVMTHGPRQVNGIQEILCQKKATIGPGTQISLRDIVKMVRHQSGTLCSLAQDSANRAIYGETP